MHHRVARDMPTLVIDDSVAIRARMAAYLADLGVEDIRQAGSVREGLELFRERPADLVFLDLVMDEERGVEFAAEALALRPLANIIVMTALPPDDDQVTLAIAEGARSYLAKPFTRATVETALGKIDADAPKKAAPTKREDPNYA